MTPTTCAARNCSGCPHCNAEFAWLMTASFGPERDLHAVCAWHWERSAKQAKQYGDIAFATECRRIATNLMVESHVYQRAARAARAAAQPITRSPRSASGAPSMTTTTIDKPPSLFDLVRNSRPQSRQSVVRTANTHTGSSYRREADLQVPPPPSLMDAVKGARRGER